ncbi:MAG: tail protein X [Negativicutes bacterium]|nr:tail protein X [Negativicutes bacterium]
MREYITTQGDTWDMISYKVYGSEMHMNTLIDANPEHRETVFFSANVRLKVPEIATPSPTKLPPWKRRA